MKILLVNEASGVHKNLRDGLRELGHQADLVMPIGRTYQGRQADILFGADGGGVIGHFKRNVILPYKIQQFYSYDLINFVLGITVLLGKFVRYSDIIRFKENRTLLSYYGVGCDEISLIRVREDSSQFTFCQACMEKDDLGKSCERENLKRRTKANKFGEYFDFSISSAPCYDHCHTFFNRAKLARVQFPVNVKAIPFHPASSKKKMLIAHAPTRRGFKGTDTIQRVINKISKENKADFDFILIEGVSHPEYVEKLKQVDLLIDQLDVPIPGMAALEAMAMGKVVITGNKSEYHNYLPFYQSSPAIHGSSLDIDLENAILSVVYSKISLEDIGERSRQFVVDNHDHIKVASIFEKTWFS